MKRFIYSIVLLLLVTTAYTQKIFSGAYGYSFNPPENTGNDKNATGPKGSLVLLQMDGYKYRFWLDVTLGWPNYNLGETDGTILFINDTASFDNTFEDALTPCILKFKINGNTITINSLSTSFNCGFGNGVNADGDYTKLNNQPVFNNAWLKKEYHQSPAATVIAEKAEVFQDENCLHSFTPKKYFQKGDSLLSIAETEKTMYTEYIPSPGKFVYGWIKKSAIKIIASE
jgi:hypothetical protein